MNVQTDSVFWQNELASSTPENCDIPATEKLLDLVLDSAGIPGFTAEQLEQLKNTVNHIRSDRRLLALWKTFYDVLYGEKMTEALKNNPYLEASMDNAPAFYLTLTMAGIPHGEKCFREKGWPVSVYHEGLADVGIWADDCQTSYGKFGIHWSLTGWLFAHHTGALFQFGRLQCNTSAAYFDDSAVYRNSENGQVLAILDGEYDFNSDGLVAMEGDQTAFRSGRIVKGEGTVTGHPVTPQGIVSPDVVTLNLDSWQLVLKADDPVINLHIPASGPLRTEDCAKSTEEMFRFFEKHMPSNSPKALVCHSWLLDPQFSGLLAENSNLLAFQRAGYLLPSTLSADHVKRVFGQKAVEQGIESVPHTTAMQKSLAAFARNGGKFRSGKLFLLKEDLPWGSNPYNPSKK